MRFKIRTLLMMTAIVAVCLSCLRMNTVPFLHPLLQAALDHVRDHEMRLSTQVKGYSITLVQNMDSDFGDYNTYFEISSPAHQNVSRLHIKVLGSKWRRPNIFRQAGRIYFRDGYKIKKSTPYIDVDAMTVTIPFDPASGQFDEKCFPLNKLRYTGNFDNWAI